MLEGHGRDYLLHLHDQLGLQQRSVRSVHRITNCFSICFANDFADIHADRFSSWDNVGAIIAERGTVASANAD